MDPIGRRPVAVRPPPASETPAASAPASRPAPASAPVAATSATPSPWQVAQAGFGAVAPPAPQAAEGTWRAPADSEVGRTISGILERLKQCPITLKGDTPESLFRRAILDNKNITNDQLLAMSRVPFEKLDSGPEARDAVLKRIPNARELPVHKFTVAMMSAVTGIDAEKLSQACPDLGMTGSASTPLLFAAKGEGLERSTALHDFTDYMRAAGVEGVNKAVWGVENRVLSAIVSAVGGGRY